MYMLPCLLYIFTCLGKRQNDEKEEDGKCNDISMNQDELEGEDYLFQTHVDDEED